MPYYAGPPYAGPLSAVMLTKTRKQTSHTFHLLMTILTGGTWGLFVWLPIAIYNSMRHDKAVTRVNPTERAAITRVIAARDNEEEL